MARGPKPLEVTDRTVEAPDERVYHALLRGSLGQIRAKRARLIMKGRAASTVGALSLSIREALHQRR